MICAGSDVDDADRVLQRDGAAVERVVADLPREAAVEPRVGRRPSSGSAMPPSVDVATHGCFAMCSMSNSAIEKPRMRAPPGAIGRPSIWIRIAASTGSSFHSRAISASDLPYSDLSV